MKRIHNLHPKVACINRIHKEIVDIILSHGVKCTIKDIQEVRINISNTLNINDIIYFIHFEKDIKRYLEVYKDIVIFSFPYLGICPILTAFCRFYLKPLFKKRKFFLDIQSTSQSTGQSTVDGDILMTSLLDELEKELLMNNILMKLSKKNISDEKILESPFFFSESDSMRECEKNLEFSKKFLPPVFSMKPNTDTDSHIRTHYICDENKTPLFKTHFVKIAEVFVDGDKCSIQWRINQNLIPSQYQGDPVLKKKETNMLFMLIRSFYDIDYIKMIKNESYYKIFILRETIDLKDEAF